MTESSQPRVKGLLAQALSISSGTALGQVALIAVTPLLTRMYSVESVGALGILTAFLSVSALFVTFRLDMAIPSAVSDADANRLLRITLTLVGPASVAVAPCVLLVDFGGTVQGLGAHVALVVLTAGATAAAACFSALRYWHVRRMNFAQIGRGVAAQGCARAASPVLLGFIWPNWFGLACGDSIGRLFGMLSLGREVRRIIRDQPRDESPRSSLREFLHGFRRFPLLLMPSSVLDAIASNMPVIIVAKLFGLVAAGEYALVMRMASAPGALLGVSIADVFHARLSECLRTSPQEATAQLRHAALRLAAIGAALYIPAAILAPMLFGFFFGEQWSHAGVVFAILSPYLLAGFIVSPLSRALVAANRMELKLIADILFLIVPVACLWLTRHLGFNTSLLIFACVQALIFGCYGALIVRAVAAPRN